MKPPTDMLGNDIVQGMVVYLLSKTPVLYKVVGVDNGGIHTPNGRTPAIIRLQADIGIGQPAESSFQNIVKIAMPNEESALLKLADHFSKG